MTTELGRAVGAKIRTLREARGTSQRQLANGIGLSQAVISQYELGMREIRATTAIRIAAFFDVSLSELLDVQGVIAVRDERIAWGVQAVVQSKVD